MRYQIKGHKSSVMYTIYSLEPRSSSPRFYLAAEFEATLYIHAHMHTRHLALNSAKHFPCVSHLLFVILHCPNLLLHCQVELGRALVHPCLPGWLLRATCPSQEIFFSYKVPHTQLPYLLFWHDSSLLLLQVTFEVARVGVHGRAKGGSQTQVLVQLY